MFTGLVQGLGEVRVINRAGRDCRIELRPLFALQKIQNGESIAVNGVCLSVEKHHSGTFIVFASEETLAHTTLDSLRPGMRVNLEQALALGDRLGGHIVSGHVDCVAVIRSRAMRGQSCTFKIAFPRDYGPEVIMKGSVALDGISLTVNSCGQDYLEVNVIPDTQARTNMPNWRVGTRVNMETDVIGKYVRRLAQPWLQAAPAESPVTSILQNFML